MKTLNQEIEDIKKANISRAAKKQGLVKLGLTANEVSLIMSEIVSNAEPRTTFTFGVEIECGVFESALRQAAAQTSLSYQYEGYNHRDGHNHFKFVSDGSLHLEGAIECVSPVLKGKDGQQRLKNACDTLRIANARVNRTCGLHVHIGASKLTPQQYANVFINYYFLEEVIDTFMAQSRRGHNSQWAQTLQRFSDLVNCTSRCDILRVMGNQRYFKVNPQSYERHRTIEFRQHQGTTDFTKIINWVMFCGRLVNWSKKNRLTAKIESIDEIPFLTKKEKEFFNNRANELN